jgi:hypothetical protein
MVHNDGPQFADTTAVAAREVTAGQRFLIGDASLGWNPSFDPHTGGAMGVKRLDGLQSRPLPARIPKASLRPLPRQEVEDIDD